MRPVFGGLVLNCLPLKPSLSAALAENFSGALHTKHKPVQSITTFAPTLMYLEMQDACTFRRAQDVETYSLVPMVMYEDFANTPLPPASKAASSSLLLFMVVCSPKYERLRCNGPQRTLLYQFALCRAHATANALNFAALNIQKCCNSRIQLSTSAVRPTSSAL